MKISESEMEIMRLVWDNKEPVSAAWLMQWLPAHLFNPTSG